MKRANIGLFIRFAESVAALVFWASLILTGLRMFSFKINPGQFQKIEANLKAEVKKVLSSDKMLNEAGTMLVERIQYQARIGKPLNEEQSFPALAKSTVKRRQYLAEHNQTHSTFDARRSNLTITGDLLDSLAHRVLGAGRLTVQFFGQHLIYKGKNGPLGREVSNRNLGKWLAEKGFKVFDNSIRNNKTIMRRLNSIVRRHLRLGLKTGK